MFPVRRGVLRNVSDPQSKTYSADRIGECEMGFAVPRRGIGRTVFIQQITSPKRDQAIDTEQSRCCARYRLVRPLALCLYAEMSTGFCEGYLDLPAPDEERDDVGRVKCYIGTEECLRVSSAFGIADQYPADCGSWRPWAIPDCGVGSDLQHFLFVAIPCGDTNLVPARCRV